MFKTIRVLLSIPLTLVFGGCGTLDPLWDKLNENLVENDCEKNPNECDDDGDGPTEAGGDCDPAVYPDATEIWYDGIDQNCDGNDDDADGDGFGYAGDCDDGDPAVYPGAAENCDGVDNDCDSSVDDDDNDVVITTTTLWFPDDDADGYGGDTSGAFACKAPENYVENNEDCDDGDPAISPDGTEIYCDGIDNDCDEHSVDEPTRTWYADEDGDGYGDGDNYVTESRCDIPEGYDDDHDDCDDSDAAVNPSATETCDGLDNDCDGDIDEEVCAGE